MKKESHGNKMIGIFPTPIYFSSIKDERVIDNAIASLVFPSAIDESRRCTEDNLHTLPEFKELSDILLAESKLVLDEMTIIRDSEYITCMWANKDDIGLPHSEHVHPNSLWSGVLYLQVPYGAGSTLFIDPRQGANMISPDYEDQTIGTRWGRLPFKGALVMFPSWLPHCVESSPKELGASGKRISLSWNIMIRSKVQVPTAKIEY